MKLLFLIIVFVLIIEYVLKIIIKKNKKIRWLITDTDEIKKFNKKKFYQFKKNSYDFSLGWDNKRESYDLIGKKKISYTIESKGYRKTSFKKNLNKIVTFGDSYNFCRQVEDKNTWQEHLSKEKKIFVSNFGVGNYGLDQAYLKYKKTKRNKFEKVVIFCFVPETICRIQSSWKNYIEFGNIHAFKPYCILKNNKLIIKKNPLKASVKFENLKKIINYTKKNDRFFREKYSKHLLRFPFTLSFIKKINFNLRFFYEIFKNRNIQNVEKLNDKIFPVVMKNNIVNSHKLYKEFKSIKILSNLIEKINKDIYDRKKKCIFLIIPQLYDLKLSSRSNYQFFFENLDKKIHIIDTTEKFIKLKNFKKMYINDKYGGHLNKKGNKFISKTVKKYLEENENNFKING